MTYSPYGQWLNDLTQEEFHEHVAGRLDSPYRAPTTRDAKWTQAVLIFCMAFWITVGIIAYEIL